MLGQLLRATGRNFIGTIGQALQKRGINTVRMVAMDRPNKRPRTNSEIDDQIDRYIAVLKNSFKDKPDNTLGVGLLGEFAWHDRDEMPDLFSLATSRLGEWLGLSKVPEPFEPAQAAYLGSSFAKKLAEAGFRNVIVSTGTMVVNIGKTEDGRNLYTNTGFLVNSEQEYIQLTKQAESNIDPTLALPQEQWEFLGRDDNSKPFRINDKYGDRYCPIGWAGICLDVTLFRDRLSPANIGFIAGAGTPDIVAPRTAVFMTADTLANLPLWDKDNPSGAYTATGNPTAAKDLQDRLGDRITVLDREVTAAGLEVAFNVANPPSTLFQRVPSDQKVIEGIQCLVTEVTIDQTEVTQDRFEALAADEKRVWTSFVDADVLDPSNFSLDPTTGQLVRKDNSLDPTGSETLSTGSTDPPTSSEEHGSERFIFDPAKEIPGMEKPPKGEEGTGGEGL